LVFDEGEDALERELGHALLVVLAVHFVGIGSRAIE
jgi:hypothetical protein